MEKNKVLIKKATVNNIDEILQIQDFLAYPLISKKALQQDLLNKIYLYYIAYIDDIPVGFIAISSLVDTIDLQYIVVNNNYQRSGIGTLLFMTITNYAKANNISKILLEVRASNLGAINFYTSLGFSKISERKNYYTDTHETAYIYQKLL